MLRGSVAGERIIRTLKWAVVWAARVLLALIVAPVALAAVYILWPLGLGLLLGDLATGEDDWNFQGLGGVAGVIATVVWLFVLVRATMLWFAPLLALLTGVRG